MPESQPIVIEQLGGERRKVVLSGGALPNQGVETGIGQRLERQFLPGASEAVVQVLGLDLPDLTFVGQLNDALLDGPGDARALVEQMFLLVTEAQPVEVSWGDSGAFARRGYVTSFRPVWQLADLVDWTLTLSPYALAQPIPTDQITFGPSDEGEAAGATGKTSERLRSAQSGGGLDVALGAL